MNRFQFARRRAGGPCGECVPIPGGCDCSLLVTSRLRGVTDVAKGPLGMVLAIAAGLGVGFVLGRR